MTAPLHAALADGPPGGWAQWLQAADGVRLRVAFWPAGPRGTVLLFPGRTEYIEKYGRAATDLARRGYATAVIDWRGQGLSDRPLAEPMLGHVQDFPYYQRDVAALLAAVGAAGLPAPLYLLAHSMGGCIGLRALSEGLPVRAAVFTAPMWGLQITPAARPFAWALAWGARLAGRGNRLAPSTQLTTYVATAAFADNVLTTDPEMFAWMQAQVAAEPALALGGPSLHWVAAALAECRRLRALPSPAVPVLTLLGTRERVVPPAAVHDRMARWPGGRLQIVPDAEHEVMMETPAIRAQSFDAAAAWFETHR